MSNTQNQTALVVVRSAFEKAARAEIETGVKVPQTLLRTRLMEAVQNAN